MSGRTRSKTIAIDADKLRLFCRAHGGVNHVSKTVGKAQNYMSCAVKRGTIGPDVLDQLCAAYAKTPTDFLPNDELKVTESEGFKHITYKPNSTGAKPVSNEITKPSIVDDLISDMAKTNTGCGSLPDTNPVQPASKIGVPKPGVFSWKDKTLQEMTGEDLLRLGENLLTKLIVEMEHHSVSVNLSLKRDGGKYGW